MLRHRSIVTAAAALIAGTLSGTAASAEGPPKPGPHGVGLTSIQIPDGLGIRPLHVHILYPTDARNETQLVNDDRVRFGIEVQEDAQPSAGRFPLLLVSHGLYGRWRNYGWLGHALASRGVVVATPTHPGTAWTNRESPETAKLWERPRDLSRVIDHLTESPEWRSRVDAERIAAFGHSLGGYTVMAAAGAVLDPALHDAYCEAHPDRGDCKWFKRVAIGQSESDRDLLKQPLGDPRIGAVVSYDLGGTQGFDPKSVAEISTPTLVIGAGAHLPDLPVAAESRRLAELLPAESVQYEEIADISHFSIFQRCKPGAEALLAAAGEGDEIICRDGEGRDRQTLHGVLWGLISEFLVESGIGLES